MYNLKLNNCKYSFQKLKIDFQLPSKCNNNIFPLHYSNCSYFNLKITAELYSDNSKGRFRVSKEKGK